MAVMDESNPLYIHYSDNPDLMHVSHPLYGDNYSSWKNVIKGTLLSENKYGFVDGSIPKHVGCSAHSLWLYNNNIVAS